MLATNLVLKEMGITQNVLCEFCNLVRDNLQHCMRGCRKSSHVKTVKMSITSNLMKKTILFGTDINFKSDKFLDFMVLSAKLFIHSCRLKKIISKDYAHSEKELKKRFQIEAYNQTLKLNLPVFLLEWAIYKPIIMLE